MKYLFHCLMFVFFIYLMPLRSMSQTDILSRDNNMLIRVGAGIDLHKLRDTEFSSLLYSGLMPSFNIHLGFGNNIRQQLSMSYATGTIKAENAEENSANYQAFNTDYFISKSAKYATDKRWYIEPGAGFNFIFSERKYKDFINQNISKEFIGSLSMYFNVIYVLSESSDWTISDRIFIPALSVISQPEIWSTGGGEPNGNSERALKTNVYFVPDYFRVNNTITLSKNLNDKHGLHLSYTWDFYQIEEVFQKERICHSLAFSYQLKF